MDHEAAVPHLSDHARGRLPAGTAAEVEAHLGECADCRQVLGTMKMLREEAAGHGDALFDAHPDPESLVWYAVSAASLGTPELARIGAHARACPTCLHEITVTRRAASGPGPLARVRQFLLPDLRTTGFASAFAPALVALVVVLAWPAYRGIVSTPRLEHDVMRMRDELGSLRVEGARLHGDLDATRTEIEAMRSWSGGVGLLFLEGTTRAGEASLPVVTLRAGQPFQPIIIEYDFAAGSSPRPIGPVAVRLLASDGHVAWELEAPLDRLVDPANHVLSLLVPARVLTDGTYRLDIREPGSGIPLFEAGFEVAAGR